MKIYHNPRCRKSRETLQLINEKGHELEIIEYLKEVPSKDEMENLLEMLDMKAEQLLRKGEKDYKEQIKGKELSESQIINKMLEFPKLIERPIVVNNKKAAIGRPPENVLEIL